MYKLLSIALWTGIVGWAQGQTCQPPTDKKATEVPLCLVAQQVTRTLDAFNLNAAGHSLPQLSSVAFDFRTSASTTAGFSFNILVFSFGKSREADTSNEVTFTYAVPPPPAAQSRATSQTHDFSAALLETLQAAAAQVRQTEAVGQAKFTSLTVTLAYGVVWDTTGGGSGTVRLVTLDGTIDRKRADVQTLTLTFTGNA